MRQVLADQGVILCQRCTRAASRGVRSPVDSEKTCAGSCRFLLAALARSFRGQKLVTLMVPSWNQIRDWLVELRGLAATSPVRAQQALEPVLKGN